MTKLSPCRGVVLHCLGGLHDLKYHGDESSDKDYGRKRVRRTMLKVLVIKE